MGIAEAIINEFSCYYQADELGVVQAEAFWRDVLPQLTWSSAVRLRREVGTEGEATLIAALRAMRDDSSHPLVGGIEHATNFRWTDDPLDWALFGKILDQIIANIINPRTTSKTA